MIKAIVLDIDGVIVGNKQDYNFPHPSEKISSILLTIHDRRIPVSFLTGKPAFAAAENIKAVGIDNPHIANAGATIFNPLRNEILHTQAMQQDAIENLLKAIGEDIYTIFFDNETYYTEKRFIGDFTEKYSQVVERKPTIINTYKEILNEKPLVKINFVAFNEQEKERISKILTERKHLFSFNWSTHPYFEAIPVMVVTAHGVSKRSGVEYLAQSLDVPFENILGVGDTIQDWDFIELCGYKAAMGNASEELKKKINQTDPKQTIGGHVNEDGLLDIFKYFKLIP